MIRLDCYKEASRLAFAHMKPGVITNHVMTAQEYKADVAMGTLYAHKWPGGVLFMRKRKTYHMLSYYINDYSLPDCTLPEDAFMEVAYKPSGVDDAYRAVRFWEQAGLLPIFERTRLTRNITPSTKGGLPQTEDSHKHTPHSHQYIEIALPPDADACMNMIYDCFDHHTGHIPDECELHDSIKAGHVLCMKDVDGSICGLLRWIPRAASIEIRQLALREDMRGKGMARNLLTRFVDMIGNNKITVWARDGYAPALKSYTASGFVADGWRSFVLTV